MKSKSNTLLLAAVALVAMTVPVVRLVSNRNAIQPDPTSRQPGSHRDRQAERREKSHLKSGKTIRTLSNGDLLTICDREGAAAALAAAKSQPWPNRDSAVYFILSHLAIENPEFVAGELKTAGLSTFLKSGVVDALLKNWKDGRKALDWAENQLTGELHCKAVAGALGILAKSEPDVAFAYLEKMSPGETRRQTICELFAAWGSQDPESALMKARELTSGDSQSATEHVLRGWAKADPATAAAWVLETAPADGGWLAGVYQSWISISPQQAQLWFDSLPEGDAKKNAHLLTYRSSHIEMPVFSTRRVMDDSWISKSVSERTPTDHMHWAIQATAAARSFVEQNANDPASKQLAAQVARAISGKDGPSVAMDWALGLSAENGIRGQALWSFFDDWSERDPEAAGKRLASMPPEDCGKLPISLVNTWVKQDPAAAADWVTRWKGEDQTMMIWNVIDKWPDQDPKAAYQWLGTLPAGAGRDGGIEKMIRRERDSAPDTLQPWIDLIFDTQLRETMRLESDQSPKLPLDR
jgi:hypothetical protein